MFLFYSSRFTTVEINYSFYHTPKESTILSWYESAPPGFKYSLKVPRLITHRKKLAGTDDLIRDFSNLALSLKEKLGMVLFQMPPSFSYSTRNMEKLKNVFGILNKQISYAIEFRHASMFQSDEVSALCRNYNVAMALISAPGLPRNPVPLEGPVYLRLHGKDKWYGDNYSNDELGKLVLEVKPVVLRKDPLWIYFNNDYKGYAVKNAIRLKELLAEPVNKT